MPNEHKNDKFWGPNRACALDTGVGKIKMCVFGFFFIFKTYSTNITPNKTRGLRVRKHVSGKFWGGSATRWLTESPPGC